MSDTAAGAVIAGVTRLALIAIDLGYLAALLICETPKLMECGPGDLRVE